jgi:uncharacterized membrane protein YeiH
MNTQELTASLEGAAVIVSAVSGMLKAAEKKMDIVGAYSLALLVSFGGGTVRDLLLQRRPFFWVEHEIYLLVILLLCIAFVYLPSVFYAIRILYRRTNTVDAMGLALFTLTGLQFAVVAGLPFLPASIIGVITGVAGGVFRDIVVNEIPVIFRPGGLYAIAAFAGTWTYIALRYFSIDSVLSSLIAFCVIVVLRLTSVYFGIRLPHPLWYDEKRDK